MGLRLRKSAVPILLLLLIVVIAGVLRLHRITRENLWLNEFWALYFSTGRGDSIFQLPLNAIIPHAPAVEFVGAPPLWRIWNGIGSIAHPPLSYGSAALGGHTVIDRQIDPIDVVALFHWLRGFVVCRGAQFGGRSMAGDRGRRPHGTIANSGLLQPASAPLHPAGIYRSARRHSIHFNRKKRVESAETNWIGAGRPGACVDALRFGRADRGVGNLLLRSPSGPA
jgi:hypothetical protein